MVKLALTTFTCTATFHISLNGLIFFEQLITTFHLFYGHVTLNNGS